MSSFPHSLHALLRARAYPHRVRAVDLIETHISWVLLTGKFAYKIKRPVHYAFVDLRSSDHAICRQESARIALHPDVGRSCAHAHAGRGSGTPPPQTSAGGAVR